MQGRSVLLLLLLAFHLGRRMLETLLLMQYPADSKMHVAAYLFGMR